MSDALPVVPILNKRSPSSNANISLQWILLLFLMAEAIFCRFVSNITPDVCIWLRFSYVKEKQGRIHGGWIGAVFEVTWSLGQEQWGHRPQKPKKKVKCDERTDGPTKQGVESCSTRLKTNWYYARTTLEIGELKKVKFEQFQNRTRHWTIEELELSQSYRL